MSDQTTETTPLITAEEINRIVSARKVEIVNTVLNSIVNDAKASISYDVRNQITAALSGAIGDVVKESLAEHQEEIAKSVREEIVVACSKIGTAMAEKLVEIAVKNMSSSYNMGKVIDGLFR